LYNRKYSKLKVRTLVLTRFNKTPVDFVEYYFSCDFLFSLFPFYSTSSLLLLGILSYPDEDGIVRFLLDQGKEEEDSIINNIIKSFIHLLPNQSNQLHNRMKSQLWILQIREDNVSKEEIESPIRVNLGQPNGWEVQIIKGEKNKKKGKSIEYDEMEEYQSVSDFQIQKSLVYSSKKKKK
jgi:hypothetical protein